MRKLKHREIKQFSLGLMWLKPGGADYSLSRYLMSKDFTQLKSGSGTLDSVMGTGLQRQVLLEPLCTERWFGEGFRSALPTQPSPGKG